MQFVHDDVMALKHLKYLNNVVQKCAAPIDDKIL